MYPVNSSPNTTFNLTLTLTLPLSWTVVVGTVQATLVLCIILGNLLVFATFALTRTLQTFSNYLVLNLAVADFLVGVVSTPFYSLDVLLGGWHLGRVMCMWWMTTDWIACASSSFSLFVISLDRYIHIAFPFWAKRHKSKYLLAAYISLPWTIAALAFIPLTVFWEEITGSTLVPERECNVPYYHSYWLLLFNLGITILLPFSMTAVLNVMLYVKIRRRWTTLANMRMGQGHTCQPINRPASNLREDATCMTEKSSSKCKSSQGTVCTSVSQSYNPRVSSSISGSISYEKHLKNNKKARSLFIFVFVFGMFWVPFVIAVYVRAFCTECRSEAFSIYEIASTFLIPVNSALNPILYAVLRPKIKDGFKRLFNRIRCCTRESQTTSL
jgi:hypothetical protein